MLDKTISKTSYRGGDGLSVFPIPFPFLENSHIVAVVRNDDDITRILTAGIDFAINRISEYDGELILLGDALAADRVLHISRRVPLTQDILFHNQGPNSPQAVEEAVDKLTMIAQQLDADVDGRLAVPEGMDADTLRDILLSTPELREETLAAIARLETALGGKASLGHAHRAADISDFSEKMAVKADLDAVVAALAGKAGKAELLAKADWNHNHVLGEVTGLTAALAGKLDADDPRLEGIQAGAHAASHAADGSDPILPQDIGCLPIPPADGNPYLAAAGGWIRYIAASGGEGGEEGGTLDHSQLLNRDAADQHPQSAILNLERDLANIRGAMTTLDGTARALATGLSGKADRDELPGPATPARDGLLSAADKNRLDSLANDGMPAGGEADSVMARDSLLNAVWKTPAQLAASLPFMSANQAGVARLAAGGGLAMDAQGGLKIVDAGGAQTLYFTTDGTSSEYSLAHALDTHNVLVSAYAESDGGRAHFGIRIPAADRVVLTAAPPRPAGETYRVVIAAAGAGDVETLPAGREAGRLLGSNDSNQSTWMDGEAVVALLPNAAASRPGIMTREYAEKLDGLYPSAIQTFHVNPAGDDAWNTPGTAAKPFKSLRGAFNALTCRQNTSPFSINIGIDAGTYPKEDLNFPGHALSLQYLLVGGANAENPPRLETDHILFQGRQEVYLRNLSVQVGAGIYAQYLTSLNIDSNCRFRFTGTDQYLFNALAYGQLYLAAAVEVDCANQAQQCLFFSGQHGTLILGNQLLLTLANAPSFVRTAVVENYSGINVYPSADLEFDPAIAGQRHQAFYYGFLRMNGHGAYYFPGDAEGYVDTSTHAFISL